MTIGTSAALFATMLAISMVPGPSDVLVVGRTVAAGFAHGVAVTAGVVVADFLLIVAAIFALGALTAGLGAMASVVHYSAGLALIGLGIAAWCSRAQGAGTPERAAASRAASFAGGLVITLGDPKALVFYLSLLPAFLDLSSVSLRDALIVMLAATAAIALVKLAYALLADRAQALLRSARAQSALSRAAGGVLAATGVYLLIATASRA